MAHILVIEDNETMQDGIARILFKMGHEAKTASSGSEGVRLFQEHSPDFVITDLRMEDMDGIEVLKKIKSLAPDTMIMLITAFGTVETAVEAMKLGAFDFITKPFSPDLLRVKVETAVDLIRTKAENRFLRSEMQREYSASLIGESKKLKNLLEQVAQVAPSDSTVLITGESGTGKELVARSIHAQSKRSNKPFIKVDCAALAEGVLESELFGHEKGSFTGAISRKPGRFELADGGTIFLDEVGEIPNSTQLKLLRVLQDRSFERVGGTRTLNVDVRVLAATNKNLANEVKTGKFREDLFFRLQVVPLELPALRERKEDLAFLIPFFAQRFQGKRNAPISFTEGALSAMRAYSWPGNVRELEHFVERMSVLSPNQIIGLETLPDSFKTSAHPVDLGAIENVPLEQALEQLEKKLILEALEKTGGVKTKTAEALGIKTSALYYKLEKYGIHIKD